VVVRLARIGHPDDPREHDYTSSEDRRVLRSLKGEIDFFFFFFLLTFCFRLLSAVS
jgi:hypothetical protein